MFEGLSPEETLAKAKQTLEEWWGYWEESYDERDVASSFHHNTKGRGQWDEDDLQLLKDQGRPALTFNLGQKEVNTAVGLNQEAALYPIPVPVSAEDELTREVVAKLMEALEEDACLEEAETDADHRRHVEGEADLWLELERREDDPLQWKATWESVDTTEITWDPAAEKADGSDARGVYRSKWIGREEFEVEYPEHASRVDELFAQAGEGPSPRSTRWIESFNPKREREDRARKGANFYVDRRQQQVRIVRLQYKQAVRRWWLSVPTEEGGFRVEEVPEERAQEVREALRSVQEEGSTVPEGLEGLEGVEILDTWTQKVRWLEFIGNEILFHDDAPVPFKGFSCVRVVCYRDWKTGEPYGIWRNLKDPQMGVNKQLSTELDHLVRQVQPGTDVEEDAVLSKHAFEQATKVGGVRYLKEGALAAGRLQERQPPQLSAGHAALLEQHANLLGRISDSDSVQERAAGTGAEAAFTVAMRHHKSTLAGAIRALHWKAYQRTRARRMLEVLLDLPDAQLAAMLGDPQTYKVQGGIVTKLQQVPDPQTGQAQLQPVGQVALTDLRSLRYNITFDTRSRNKMIRLTGLNLLTTLQQMGVPVPPDLLYEKVADSAYEAERMKEHARQVMQASAQQRQEVMQMQLAAARWEQEAKTLRELVNLGRLGEDRRHHMAEERRQYLEAADDATLQLLDALIRADQGEKQMLLDLAANILRRDPRKPPIPAGGAGPMPGNGQRPPRGSSA